MTMVEDIDTLSRKILAEIKDPFIQKIKGPLIPKHLRK